VQVLKTDVQVLKTDVQVLKTDVQTLKTDMDQVREQLDRIETNQNEDVMGMLKHMDQKLNDFRHETRIEFKSLSRRVTALETDLSATMIEVETMKASNA
jgi:hypothetical protein